MSKVPRINVELIESKIQNIRDDVDDLEDTIKKEYTPLTYTKNVDKRLNKFEAIWDWALKIVLGTIIMGLLVLLGMGAK